MNLEEFKQKLISYSYKDIILTKHAKIQALFREINIEEVKKNILFPDRLVYFCEQKSEKDCEKKYDCYFSYSEKLCYRYILTLSRKVIIVTIIKINRYWQRIIERK